jgi:hypothetical protein
MDVELGSLKGNTGDGGLEDVLVMPMIPGDV